jgi:hypothetical protein
MRLLAGSPGMMTGAGFAAFEGVVGGVELEATHMFVGVAGVTVVGEEGTDVGFEEFFVGGLCEGRHNCEKEGEDWA